MGPLWPAREYRRPIAGRRLPIIEHKPAEDKFDIYKTIRWIPFKKEKAENDYEKNFENFEKHLLKPYRYYIKHPILEKDKTSKYSARPWNRGV